jgi:hypothetical protein
MAHGLRVAQGDDRRQSAPFDEGTVGLETMASALTTPIRGADSIG